jgi:hypothetical protein
MAGRRALSNERTEIFEQPSPSQMRTSEAAPAAPLVIHCHSRISTQINYWRATSINRLPDQRATSLMLVLLRGRLAARLARLVAQCADGARAPARDRLTCAVGGHRVA